MSSEAEFAAEGLVRSFSGLRMHEITQADDQYSSRRALEDALAERVNFEDAFASLLRGATTSHRTSLQVRARVEELQKAVKLFQDTLVDILKSDTPKQLSWTTISDGISRIKMQHHEKTSKGFRGRTKERFHRLCEGINNHSGVLKILPQEYAGPVTASIEVIVKASINHEQMGEDFAIALEEIDGIVQTTSRGLSLYPKDVKLQDLVAQLCCHVLAFVVVPLKWYSEGGGKRLRSSFNENASKVYERHIEAIRRLTKFIDQTVHLCTAEETHKLHLLVNSDVLSRQNRELQEERLRSKWQINESHYALFQQAADESNRQLRENPHRRLLQMSLFIAEPPSNELGQPIKQILDREAILFMMNEYKDLESRKEFVKGDGATTVVSGSRHVSERLLRTQAEVEDASGSLNEMFDYDKVKPYAARNSHFVEIEIVQRLQEWTTGSRSSFLGIFGPYAMSSENAFKLLTSSYVHAAKAANIACVSYFCDLPQCSPDPRRLPETVEASAMLCALIRQMVLHLPVRLPKHPQLYYQRFEKLDGTLKTWDAALAVLSDVMALSEAAVLLIAVYGLEVLDHDATKTQLTKFFKTLQQHVSSPTSNGPAKTILKVLFVTSGTSQVLASELEIDEICDMSRGDAAMRPGMARKGRSAMSDLDFSS